MGIKVLVVQHGEKVRAPGDPGLSDIGHRQAATVAAWLSKNRTAVGSIWASPLRRAQETAAPIAAAFGVVVQTDARLRERMNWGDESFIDLDGFLAEWRRTSEDRWYQPAIGDSSSVAAERFISALIDVEQQVREGGVVVVTHGGVTVDALRTLVGDAAITDARPDLIEDGVPCCAITRLNVTGATIAVTGYPSTSHLDKTTLHRRA